MYLTQCFIRELMERRIDVNEVSLDALGMKDPSESSRERMRLAEVYLRV
ncbi:hypothetical protein [Vulcanisaeta distributa]|nr:hypothetical protein [Vulcanisaeta distributa]